MVNWAFIRQVGPARWAVRYGVLQFRKRVLKRDTRLRLPTGITITLPRQSQTSTEIYVTNSDVDWGAEALFARFADRQRDFLDIGSHIGYYAVYLSPLVRCAYAFEPDARNLPSLRENAERSQNIKVVEMAVSSRDGTADFYTGQSSSIGSLESRSGSASKVPVTTVDSFVASHAGVDVGLIKTDIEEHDLEALRGMEKTVADFQPLILTECEFSPELVVLCSRWSYRIFGFLKERNTKRARFVELRDFDREKWHTKMLFLVPEVLHRSFAALAHD
jgi:FkbM family methyltransferase